MFESLDVAVDQGFFLCTRPFFELEFSGLGAVFRGMGSLKYQGYWAAICGPFRGSACVVFLYSGGDVFGVADVVAVVGAF
jgi:hypothetical protein